MPVEQGNMGVKQGNVAVNAGNTIGEPVGDHTGHVGMEEAVDRATSGDISGAFTRLRAAGLL